MPKQKVNKEFIVHQALKLFRQKSYHQATMADIADACGLLKGSIYHYFKSKDELMIAVLALNAGAIDIKTSYLIQTTTLITFIVSSYLIMLRYPTPIAVSDRLRKD